MGSAGDEMGQVLNERGRELAQLLKILRNRHFVPHHDLPLMILGFRRILHFLLYRKKEREQEPVSVLVGDEQEVVNRPPPVVGQERKRFAEEQRCILRYLRDSHLRRILHRRRLDSCHLRSLHLMRNIKNF